jgi:pimeloyl-ACP methyl ester carboxylesterase
MVFIPALGCTGALYKEVLNGMPKGIASSVHIPRANSYSQMVKDLLAQSPAKFVVAGTSMGAGLALETTLAAPDRVAGLIMMGMGAGAVADKNAGLLRSRRLRGGELEAVLADMSEKIAYRAGPRGPDTIEAFKTMARELGTETMAAQSDALAGREDRWAALADIACPVLCLWGEKDEYCPPEDGKRIAVSVQRGTFSPFSDCGHLPTLEQPTLTIAIVRAWLSLHGLTA